MHTMKNVPCPGEIIREDITVVTDADKSKVANHLSRARALRSDLGDIKFDANDIDAFKRNGRRE